MDNYDIFARFYDEVMGDRSDVVTMVKNWITRYRPDAANLLELGCGTGSILAGLTGSWTRTGLDLSENMLKIAQRKIPNSIFIKGDIGAFRLDERFDVAYCVFDTINHLNKFDKWKAMFACTADHLTPGGLFIFDMNTVHRTHALAAMPTFVQEIDGATVEMDIYPDGKNTVEWHTMVQQLQADGLVQVYEDHARETAFPAAKVEKALTKRFDVLECVDAAGNPPSAGTDRIYYVCRVRSAK